MRIYYVISIALFVISIAMINDSFIAIILGIPALLVATIFQVIALALIKRKVTRPNRHAFLSVIPAMVFFVFSGLSLSAWSVKREVFEIVTTIKYPESIEDFAFIEDSWTDYSVRFYCKVSPEDFKKLIVHGDFHSNDLFAHRAMVEISIPGCEVDSIENTTVYRRELTHGVCTLYANSAHDQIYAIYSVD